jgi:drug/metabolite transporter (DMT)-like permease
MVAPLRNHPQFSAYVALIALCFLWGTTYLAIRIALESFGPATLVCFRNLLSGPLILAGGKIAGAHIPRGREFWTTALLGVLIIGVGNGTLAYAEQQIPSGLAALFVATAPFWFAGAEAAIPGGEPLRAGTIRGMLVGSVGVALLLAPAAMSGSIVPGRALVIGFVLLQLSQASWVIFSIVHRRRTQTAHPFIGGAIQQFASGVVFIVPALFEKAPEWTWRGAGAIVYLALFGGIAGYSCYALVMTRLPVSVASSYTYANPVVAVILGWIFYREPFGWREAAAMGVVFLGVALVRRASMVPKSLRS